MKEELKTKEVQKTIFNPHHRELATEEEFFNVLRLIAPGTHMRTALEGILKGGKGALIVIENDALYRILDGGFKINTRFTSQRLMELSKMDGAIILSKDMKRIILANTVLAPDNRIGSVETGTRHKSAERTAKQIGSLVIAISERRHTITLYFKNLRYLVSSSEEVLRKVNEQIQMLERQRELFDRYLEKLTFLELHSYPSISQAISVIQKGRIILKIASDLQRYLIELGKEGTLLKTRLKEITFDVEKETDLVIKDYTNHPVKRSKTILEEMSYDDLSEKDNVIKSLNYEKPLRQMPVKGWRVLSKTSLSEADVASLVLEVETLYDLLHASEEFYVGILGEDKSHFFKTELNQIKASY